MDFSVDLSKEAEEKLAQLPELKKIKMALLVKDVAEKYIEVETSEIEKRKSLRYSRSSSPYIKPR